MPARAHAGPLWRALLHQGAPCGVCLKANTTLVWICRAGGILAMRIASQDDSNPHDPGPLPCVAQLFLPGPVQGHVRQLQGH